MKKLKCQYCEGVWIVEDTNLERQRSCPYCQFSIQEEIKFVKFDSLAKVIWGAISKHGLEVLQDSQKFTDYMLTNAPALKKEIRIFTRTVTEEYMDCIMKVFVMGMKSIEDTIEKLWHQFIEEEGLSEGWADIICAGLLGAILYSRGIGNTRLINVSVDDLPDVRQWKLYITSDNASTPSTSSKVEIPAEEEAAEKKTTKPSTSRGNTNEEPERIMKQVLDFYNHGAYNHNAIYIKNEQEAIKRLKHLATTYQYMPAYNLLGKIYLKSNRVAYSKDWCTPAAEAGDIEAICVMCHHNDSYIYFLEQHAKNASAEQLTIMTSVAHAFFAGQELPKDEKTAIAIWEIAAKFGCADAQFQLAQRYQDGIGIPQDPHKAIELYRDAALNGHTAAQHKLQALTAKLTFIQRFKLKLL